MKRPLCIAIAFALSIAAGCSAPTQRSAQSGDTAQERDASVLQDAAPPRPVEPAGPVPADGRERAHKPVALEENRRADDGTLAGASATLRQAKVTAQTAVAMDEPMPMSIAAPPPAPSAPPAIAYTTAPLASVAQPPAYTEPNDRERYADIEQNPVQRVAEVPVSTFSIDVDTGSYSNVRRMLRDGRVPPADAVRTEEFVNYFDYAYAPPADRQTPFSVTTEIAPAPWNPARHLLLVGIEGYDVPAAQIPPANLVFLIDTSGSMQSPDKIDLLKQGFRTLVASLRPQDRVAIVAYAGSAGLVLEPTSGSDKEAILAAIDRLAAGGSTNGAAGIELAYQVAQRSRVDGGINRVILATDGDFNVGTVSVDALKALVRERRESGVALTTLGFGRDNYNDELAEQLADIGNGNHAYVDSMQEANKVLSTELSSTLFTIAKDVKIQLEFNPAVVAEYRLLGYENRALRREDFDNDQVDAGEIGAGHDVTALYEIALVGSGGERIPPLRYAAPQAQGGGGGDELGFLRLRYKAPDGERSRLIEQPIARRQIVATPPPRLRFAATVAAFAERLRGSSGIGDYDYADLRVLLDGQEIADPHGQVAELRELIGMAETLAGPRAAQN